MIKIEGLVKTYGDKTAVDGVDFEVDAGEVFGLVGPNGAGKTTTFKVLATLARPDAGRVLIEGRDTTVDVPEVRRSLGFMPDSFGGYDSFRVTEYLDYFGALYGMRRRDRLERAEAVLELTELTGKRDDSVRALSKGMKQRLCLAKTLLHDPEVLILDEPASGLDPRARLEMRELLRELRAMGKTLVLSSHILPELESLCDRVGFMELGKLVACGNLHDLEQSLAGQQRIRVRVSSEEERALRVLESTDGVVDVQVERGSGGRAFRVDPTPEAFADQRVLTRLVEAGVPVRSYNAEGADLEELFMQLTKGEVS